jgi:hypothetical protein
MQLGLFCPMVASHCPVEPQTEQEPHSSAQHAPLTQLPKVGAQSVNVLHFFPPPHPGHIPPPQSTSVSLPSMTPSPHAQVFGALPHPPAIGVPVVAQSMYGSIPKPTGPHVPSGIPVVAVAHPSQMPLQGVEQQMLSGLRDCATQVVMSPQAPYMWAGLSQGEPRHAPQSGPPQSTPVSLPSCTPSVQLTHLCCFRSQIGLVGCDVMQSALDTHSTQCPSPSHTSMLVGLQALPDGVSVCVQQDAPTHGLEDEGVFVGGLHVSTVQGLPSSQSASLVQSCWNASSWKGQPAIAVSGRSRARAPARRRVEAMGRYQSRVKAPPAGRTTKEAFMSGFGAAAFGLVTML